MKNKGIKRLTLGTSGSPMDGFNSEVISSEYGGLPSGQGSFVEVSREQFYRIVGKKNVHPRIVGKWPYTSLFQDPHGMVHGKVEGFIPEGQALAESRYWLLSGRC